MLLEWIYNSSSELISCTGKITKYTNYFSFIIYYDCIAI